MHADNEVIGLLMRFTEDVGLMRGFLGGCTVCFSMKLGLMPEHHAESTMTHQCKQQRRLARLRRLRKFSEESKAHLELMPPMASPGCRMPSPSARKVLPYSVCGRDCGVSSALSHGSLDARPGRVAHTSPSAAARFEMFSLRFRLPALPPDVASCDHGIDPTFKHVTPFPNRRAGARASSALGRPSASAPPIVGCTTEEVES